MPMHTRSAALPAGGYDPETREFDLVASTGADVVRVDWATGRRYVERLDVAGADLTRLDGGASILDSHSARRLADVVGAIVPGSARVEGGAIVARGRLSSADDVAPIRQRMADGTLRSVSIGYAFAPEDVEIAAPNKDSRVMETRTIRRWSVYEVSIVGVPADAGAKIRGADAPLQGDDMAQHDVVDLDAVRREAAEAERQRAAEIRRLAPLGVDADALIASGVTVEAARKAALDAALERDTATSVASTHRGTPASSYGTSQDEHLRSGLSEALERKIGIAGEVTVGRRYMGRSALEMARQHLVDARVPGASDMSRDEVWRSVLGMTSTRAHTSSDFPELLAAALNKSLLAAYQLAPTTWERWARPKTYRDFRPHPSVRMGVAPGLKALPEGGTIEYGTFGGASESTTAVRYARGLAVTEQTLINDDLAGVAQAIAAWGQVVRRKTEALVVAVLEGNASLSDGVALFHADHDNVIASATPPSSLANIDAAVQILDAQTIASERLMLEPRYLLVPTARDLAARQVLGLLPGAQTTASALVPAGSPLGALEVIKVPGLAATYWYLAADPAVAPVVEAGYLEGRNGPVLESMIDFDTKGIKYSCVLDFGCGAVDFRGMVRVAN